VDLRVAVQSHLREKDPALAEFPVVIKAFANGDGLPGALQKLSLQPSAATEFAKGFSNAFGTSDFVFVSRGKDRVDEKIRGEFFHIGEDITSTRLLRSNYAHHSLHSRF